MAVHLHHPEGTVSIVALANGRRTIHVDLTGPGKFSPRLDLETSYSEALIRVLLDVKGPAWLCDEIARDESPDYVGKSLQNDLGAYFDFGALSGKRILDFGCGSGASTMWLARTFPASTVVGIELEDTLLTAARARLAHYGFGNVTLMRSPSGTEIPPDLGTFDLVVMSAVYEHLLPQERREILPRLWHLLRDDGCLFMNQTPNRTFPLELHTTMLPLINYLPDRVAGMVARQFSRRVEAHESWEQLLRKGIRGATVREIRANLPARGRDAVQLQPVKTGLQDRVDLWFQNTHPQRLRLIKAPARWGLKALAFATGIVVVPDLTLAFQKRKPVASGPAYASD